MSRFFRKLIYIHFFLHTVCKTLPFRYNSAFEREILSFLDFDSKISPKNTPILDLKIDLKLASFLGSKTPLILGRFLGVIFGPGLDLGGSVR